MLPALARVPHSIRVGDSLHYWESSWRSAGLRSCVGEEHEQPFVTSGFMMSWRHKLKHQWEQTDTVSVMFSQTAASCSCRFVCAPNQELCLCSVLKHDGCCSSHLLSGVSHSKPRLSEGPVGLHVAIATSQWQRWLGRNVTRQLKGEREDTIRLHCGVNMKTRI